MWKRRRILGNTQWDLLDVMGLRRGQVLLKILVLISRFRRWDGIIPHRQLFDGGDALGGHRREVEKFNVKFLQITGPVEIAPFRVENVNGFLVGEDGVVKVRQFLFQDLHLVLDFKEAKAEQCSERQTEKSHEADHEFGVPEFGPGSVSQAGSAVRMAARMRPDRARGLALVSALSGWTTPFEGTVKLGADPESTVSGR